MRAVKRDRSHITWFEIGFLILLVIFTFFVRLQSTDIPLDRDEGTYAYIAAHLDEGMLPYRDTFDHKPPFIYYLYRTGFSMFGVSAEGIRGFTTAYVIMTMLLLFIFVRTVTQSAFTAMLSALFYSMFMGNNVFQGFGANTEVFTHLPLLLSFFFALDRDEKYMKVSFFVSGFFAAAAFFVKSMVALAALVPLLYIIVMYRGDRLKASVWFVSGFASLAALVAAWAAWNRMLPQFFECVFAYNFRYMAVQGRNFSGLMAGSGVFIKLYMLPVLASAWYVLVSFTGKREPLTFVCAAGALFSYAGIAALKGAYPHYYITLIPFAAILTAMLFRDIYAMLDGVRLLKPYAAAVAALLLTANGAAYFLGSGTVEFMKRGRYTMDIFYQSRAMAQAAGDSLTRKKSDRLFVFQSEPEIYFLAGGRAPSRYIYAYPLAVYGRETAESFSREFMEAKPDVLVMEKGTYDAYVPYIDNFYRKLSETRDLVLYERL